MEDEFCSTLLVQNCSAAKGDSKRRALTQHTATAEALCVTDREDVQSRPQSTDHYSFTDPGGMEG